MNSRSPRPRSISQALALAACLAPALAHAESTIFQTTFASDLIVTPTTAAGTLTPTRANWYVMSSKNATTSSVNGIAGLRLTHASSTAAALEGAARLSAQPIQLSVVGDYLEATGTFYTDNVLNVAFGLYNSGGVEPLVTAPNGTTLLANSGLASTAGAVGGTLGWVGYRAAVGNSVSGTTPSQIVTASATGSIQVRKAQTVTPTYVAYDLISPGTGAYNAPSATSIGTVGNSTTSFLWADANGAAYKFTYRIQRSSGTAYAISYSIKDESNAVLFSAGGTTTASDAAPAAITQAFDSFAIGVRNKALNNVGTSGTLSVTELKLAGVNSDLARITVQPANQNLIPGQSGSLGVTALGTGTLAYQWYKDGGPISGATAATYPIASASSGDAGSYTVTVTNAYGQESSSVATVVVVAASAPVFTQQPMAQTVDAGTPLTLVAEASGAPTPAYQWYLDNNPISGATAPTYTVASATTANAGSYKVVATNTQGSVPSNAVTVAVTTAAPVITTPPAPVTVNVAAAINLSVVATGVPTPSYQWYKDGNLLVGATASSYSVTSATTADAGNYTVVVSNGIGSPATSAPALVTVNVVPPTVSSPPVSATVVYGNSTTLTAAYTGSQPRTYQWYRNNEVIPGATSASYTIASATLADAGAYHVTVTNSANSATSADATLSVVFANESTVFSTDFSTSTLNTVATPITATSTSWFVLASRVATSSSVGDDTATADTVETRPLTLKFTTTTGSSIVEGVGRFSATPVSLGSPGDYLRLTTTLHGKNLRVLAFGLYNSGGVAPFPLIGNPAADIIGSGTAAAGIGTQNWVGYRASLQVAGSTGDIGTRPAQTTSTTNRGNELMFPAGSTGAAFGEPAGVSIGGVPSLASSVALADDAPFTLTYTIVRSGSNQYTIDYKLYSGSSATGTPLYATSGATTNAGALPSDVTGAFDAVAIGFRNLDTTVIPEIVLTSLKIDHGVATAAAAPSFITQPVGQSLAVGDTLTLTAASSGTPTPTYQWYRNDSPISGATAATYSVTSASSANAGSYKVVATNAVGSTPSNVVTVTVGSASTPLAIWASAQGLATGVNDGATQDPDGDGVANLLEFVLGGNPLSAASAPLPVVARSGSSLTLTYDVKVAATAQFSVVPQSSTDLAASWTPAVHGTGGVTIVTTALDAQTDRVVVTLPVSGARLFARVRVVALP